MGTEYSEKNNSKGKRDFIIDCFRILALFMVLSVHYRGNGLPYIVDRLFSLGAYGVALYFLLSGYLEYQSVCRAKDYKGYLRQKARNILPMYWVSLVFTFIIGALVLKEYPVSWQWIYSVFLIHMFVPCREWMWWNSVNFYWTMSAFVGWYILGPLFLKYLNNSKKMAVGTGMAVVMTPLLKQWMYTFASTQFVNWNFFCLLYVFGFGSLAWLIVQESNYKMGFLYGIVITAAGWLAGNKSGFLVFGAGFYILILLCHALRMKCGNLRFQSIIAYMSRTTYAVYLFHWFVLLFWRSDYRPQLPWFISYILFVVIAWIVGILFYEIMKIRFGNRNRNQIL